MATQLDRTTHLPTLSQEFEVALLEREIASDVEERQGRSSSSYLSSSHGRSVRLRRLDMLAGISFQSTSQERINKTKLEAIIAANKVRDDAHFLVRIVFEISSP